MPRRLVLATTNQGKVRELRDILDGVDVTLLSAEEVALPEVDETADSFAGNARLKAEQAAAATGIACVADDSGLVVDALGGEPGIRSARYAGPQRDDDANLELVLARLADTPDAQRTGRFVCAAALATPEGTVEVVEGAIEGRILRERRGTAGFGYDPIFLPDGFEVTTAEMSAAQKHAISHRGQAFRALRPAIEAHVLR